MTCLAEHPKLDFLGPQIAADGAWYCIRRPYRLAQARLRPRQLIEDIVLFPFRLIYALFQYLNIFTMMYTGKPLAKSGTARQRYVDIQRMTVWGNLVEARKNCSRKAVRSRVLFPTRGSYAASLAAAFPRSLPRASCPLICGWMGQPSIRTAPPFSAGPPRAKLPVSIRTS
jgi:hypothetical protein